MMIIIIIIAKIIRESLNREKLINLLGEIGHFSK